MVERDGPPDISDVKAWMGPEAYKYFSIIKETIERRYPGIFSPEWLYGGKRHGWSLRYKKGRSFCTLIPEKDSFKIQIVFGSNERLKVEDIRDVLSQSVQKRYDAAKTYHDGKWLFLLVDSDEILEDVKALLTVKRKPKDIFL
jgi:hypothetical protein